MQKTTEMLWVYDAPYIVNIEESETDYSYEITLMDSEFKNTAADQPMYWTFPKHVVDELGSKIDQARTLIEFWTPAPRIIASQANAA